MMNKSARSINEGYEDKTLSTFSNLSVAQLKIKKNSLHFE